MTAIPVLLMWRSSRNDAQSSMSDTEDRPAAHSSCFEKRGSNEGTFRGKKKKKSSNNLEYNKLFFPLLSIPVKHGLIT
jgi:hypothetical protein